MSPLVCRNGHPQAKAAARFCYLCGAPVTLLATGNPANGVCQRGHPQAKSGANFCYLCGGPVVLPLPSNGVCLNGHPQIKPGARFCYVCGAAVAALSAGPTINGRYRIINEIGRGGMGSVVYRVVDTTNHQPYAMKEIDETQLQPVSDRPEIIRAFQREADLLQRFNHPNIVKVHDSFQSGIKHYMVMDLVQGKMLEDLLATSPGGFPEARVLGWAVELCDALDYLHHQTPPVIYRDMKPANVMIEDNSGKIKMLDFGIAREFKGGKKSSDTIRFGTDGYAPPEQYGRKGVETSPASDVYALGAMLHQLLTGKDPAQNPFIFDFLILSRPPVSASTRIVDALKKALASDVTMRFQTMAEFSTALTGKQPATRLPAQQAVPKKGGSPAASAGVPSQTPLPATPSTASSGTQAAPPIRSAGAGASVQISVNQLDFGQVEKGSEAPPKRSVTVTVADGNSAQVAASEDWLVPMPSTVNGSGPVVVSLATGKLPLNYRPWKLPDLSRSTIDLLKRLPVQVWWVIGLALLIGIQVRVIWQAATLLLVGWLGFLAVMWSSSRLFPRLVVYAADRTGQITISNGSSSQTIAAQVKVVPSLWRKSVGWSVLAMVILAESGAAFLVGWFLFQALGGY